MHSNTPDLRMSERNRLDIFWKLSISALALIWIGWQLYGGLTLYNDDQWPFTGYPMYSEIHHVGEPIFQRKLIGHTISGRLVAISHEDFDISYWGLVYRFNTRGHEKLLPQLVVLYNQSRADPQERLQRLDLMHEGKVMGINGASEPYKKLVFTYEASK